MANIDVTNTQLKIIQQIIDNTINSYTYLKLNINKQKINNNE